MRVTAPATLPLRALPAEPPTRETKRFGGGASSEVGHDGSAWKGVLTAWWLVARRAMARRSLVQLQLPGTALQNEVPWLALHSAGRLQSRWPVLLGLLLLLLLLLVLVLLLVATGNLQSKWEVMVGCRALPVAKESGVFEQLARWRPPH